MYDFTSAYQSLIRDDIRYHHAIQIFIQQISSATEQRRYSLASKLIDELKFTGDQIAGKLERALIRLECARAYYNSGQYAQAIRDLEFAISLIESDARKSIDHYHYCAAAQWMLGCILIERSNMRREALLWWQKSLDSFKILIYHGETVPPDNSWYEDRYNIMCQAIEDLIRGKYVSVSRPLTKQVSTQLHGWSSSSLHSGSFNFLAVIDRIPAGGFGPSGVDPFVIGRIELEPVMDEIIIEGIVHRLYNLRGSTGETKLHPSRKYFILKVAGDSMNEGGIDSDDYILVLYQDTADNFDIVAAEIINIDSQATLKRYIKEKNIVRLEPQSDNPIHEVYDFPRPGYGFFIRGVVIAVFKPNLEN